MGFVLKDEPLLLVIWPYFLSVKPTFGFYGQCFEHVLIEECREGMSPYVFEARMFYGTIP